jgi:hypothetical protein
MRKILVGLFMLLCINAAAAVYEIREEYRQDVIDYESGSERFLRQNFSVKIDKSSASLSHNYIQERGEHLFTGYINICSPAERFRFTAGNYNINFGSGLFMGTRRYASEDPFASRPFPSAGNFISPSHSANPVYSFMGLGADFTTSPSGAVRFHGGAFVSLRKRYIHNDYYDSKKIPSSMNSVNSRTAPDGPYNEPILIRDTGAAVSLDIGKNFTAELLGYYEDLRSFTNETIAWEYKEGNRSVNGIESSKGTAIHMRYSDKYIFLFCEAGITMTGQYSEKEQRGSAFSTGFRFRNEYAAFSLLLLSAGTHFYAPEASDSPFPRNECSAALSLKPAKFFQFGGTASYEHKEYPGRTEAALAATVRNGIFALAGGKSLEFKAGLDAVEYDKAAGRKHMTKETASVKRMFGKKFSIGMHFLRQKMDGGSSYSGGGGIQGEPFAFLSFGIDGSYYMIKGPGIYSTVLPQENVLASTILMNSTLASSVIKLSLKYGSARFTVRYQQFYGTSESRVECIGRASF